MARARGDHRTLDLLSWEPEAVIKRYDDRQVRTATVRARVARAVSVTLKDCRESREAIAASMSLWLGEDVTKNMLDAYASEAREDQSIPFVRLIALIQATGDVRPLQAAAELFGHAVIEDRYLPWVEVGQLADKRDELDKSFEAARRNARRRVR